MGTDRDRLREDLRQWGRRTLRGIWRRFQQGDDLSAEEVRLARILEQHPEFAPVWDGEGEEAVPEGVAGEMNPFLHVQIHMMVEDQLASGRPAETAVTLQRLEQAGRDCHEAIHDIGRVLTLELHRAMVEQRSFDMGSYVTALGKL